MWAMTAHTLGGSSCMRCVSPITRITARGMLKSVNAERTHLARIGVALTCGRHVCMYVTPTPSTEHRALSHASHTKYKTDWDRSA
jgi:hypothetical protein